MLLAAAGCKAPEQPAVTSIVGAVLLDGAGGPPVSDSVVTIEAGRIRAAGSRTALLVPPEAVKVDGSGQFIVPEAIDVALRAHAGMPEVATLKDAVHAVQDGATACLHMIRDTEAIDPALITRLRDLQIVFVPMLSAEHDRARLLIAGHNSKRLADAGVPLAVGSEGDTLREMEMLGAAGIAPADVLVAASGHGAMALHTLSEEGTLEAGKRANLLLLTANPAEDIRNFGKVKARMRDGRWIPLR